MQGSILFLVSCLLQVSAGNAANADSKQQALDSREDANALKVESKLKSELQGLQKDHYFSMLVVTVAADHTEPTHTHPGDEILYGLSGKGAVYIDGVKHEIQPGTVVQVRRGQKKSLSNEGNREPLQVLALLVLQKDLPLLEIVSEH
jgi:quercetin dioxygenase-like cupin family protein